ncbi:hypothetical protein MSG28_012907 [Choristoneura fumiferana]|uniref:Uncharacterized protein n=1 Tax=Choristoneura fumiferana TaxID=7141 RepID=A0ACC0KRW3_CHOFU|nr:hypothetical protein MSG28_012907 [Choristoneura fumiferana]
MAAPLPLPPGRCRDHACRAPPKGAMPKPPVKQPCGVCPPCAAACNADAPPTEAELEAARLAVRLDQTQDSFKRKITEVRAGREVRTRGAAPEYLQRCCWCPQCAMLRAEAAQCKEEADRERAAARDTQARLRELEQRFDALGDHAHALLRNKEQTVNKGPAVRALKQCYREARDEVDELRALLADQAVQLQDYRAKDTTILECWRVLRVRGAVYARRITASRCGQPVPKCLININACKLHAERLQPSGRVLQHGAAAAAAEEQKKQLAALDTDNTRIADQINLEVHRVKFQERLAELAPLPQLLSRRSAVWTPRSTPPRSPTTAPRISAPSWRWRARRWVADG